MTAPRTDAPAKAWRCSPGRHLPAYARELADARARDLVPSQRQVVVFLDHWPAGPVTPFGPAICCPPDARPERLDWRYLAALSVLVRVNPCPDEARVRGLLAELVAARPKRLIVLRPGRVPAAEFIISAAQGVEVQP
jgi:hypothetical protein